MLYVATGRRGWIAVGLMLAAAGAGAVGSLEPHVHSRVEDWLHPFARIAAGPGRRASSPSRCSRSAPAGCWAPGWAAGTPS